MGVQLLEQPGRLSTVDARQSNINNHDIRPLLRDLFGSLLARRSFAHEFQVGFRFDKSFEALANDWVVVYDEDTDAVQRCHGECPLLANPEVSTHSRTRQIIAASLGGQN